MKRKALELSLELYDSATGIYHIQETSRNHAASGMLYQMIRPTRWNKNGRNDEVYY